MRASKAVAIVVIWMLVMLSAVWTGLVAQEWLTDGWGREWRVRWPTVGFSFALTAALLWLLVTVVKRPDSTRTS